MGNRRLGEGMSSKKAKARRQLNGVESKRRRQFLKRAVPDERGKKSAKRLKVY